MNYEFRDLVECAFTCELLKKKPLRTLANNKTMNKIYNPKPEEPGR
jgi:hypothetical protein